MGRSRTREVHPCSQNAGAVSSGGDWEKETLTRLLRETDHGPDLLPGQTHNKNITFAVVRAS